MKKQKIEMYFVCEKCGADVQENLIDKKKSNNNWQVCKEKCPFCGNKITIKIREQPSPL